MIAYQTLNIAGHKITLGLDANLRVRDIKGNYVPSIVTACGVILQEKDLANAILRKISLN